MENSIQRVLNGDEQAIAFIIEEQKPRLFAKAFAYTKNEQDAEDIVQETFIKAFQALPKLKNPAYFSTWLYKILLRESYAVFKKKQRGAELDDALMREFQVASEETNPDYTELYQALKHLKKDFQFSIILHYFYGFKVFEIAELLEKPSNTVKMHLHRGRKMLRAQLEKDMHRPIKLKEVTVMLKEQLFELAKQYVDVPQNYTLELEDYGENGIASFMWQDENEDGAFIRLDHHGKIDDFAKIPTKKGPTISEEQKLEIAQQFLTTQYPQALAHYALVKRKQYENSTLFELMQVAKDIPLDDYFCRIEVTNAGEVILFTYTGFTENPPKMPETLYDPQQLLQDIAHSQWTLEAQLVDGEITCLYTLNETYDAQTGKPLLEEYEEESVSYHPFPQIEPEMKKETIEEMMGISDAWEREPETDAIYWRPKIRKINEEKTYDAYLERQFDNRMKAKVNANTKRLQSFICFAEIEGELDLSGADCLMRAARFIQTYYEEFTPYLQVAENNEDNEKVGFQFGIYKNGYKIEDQLFYIMISKKTGAILTFAAPTMSIEALQQFNPQQVKPLPALLDLTQLTVKAKWQGMQLVYTIRTVDGEFIRGIHAETGEVLGG